MVKYGDDFAEVPVAGKLWNWRLWIGFLLTLVALVGYRRLFEETRLVFWPSLLLFIISGFLLVSGLKRASREPQLYRGKVLGRILATLSVLVFGVFGYATYEVFTHFPAARNAPQVGQRAPEFALVDSGGKNFSLTQLLSNPITDSSGATRAIKGVLIVFYRGYW